MKKVYLDTNILLDYFNSERAYHNEARQLVYYLLTNNIQIVFSEDMISTLVYILKKTNIDMMQFYNYLSKITLDPKILICSFSGSVIRSACQMCQSYNDDFEYYLQYFCAEKENCCAIYSMDKKFPNLKIPVKRYGEIDI